MFRSLLIVFLIIPFTIVVLPIMAVGFVIGIFSKSIRFQIARGISIFASAVFFFVAGAKIHVTGKENIPKGTVLLVGNHRSFIDIPLLLYKVDFPIAFIAKKSLAKFPFLNIFMTFLGCYFLDRDNIRAGLETIKKGIKRLQSGHSLVIFPEGTRSKTEGFLPFKQGSLKLAEKSGVPVVPLAIKGTNTIFGDKGYRICPGTVYLTFGPPIYMDQLSPTDKKKSAEYVQAIVEGLYQTLG